MKEEQVLHNKQRERGGRHFTLADAERFVKQNAARMEKGIASLTAENWACVDGRVTKAGRFAGPGGALGIMFAVFAGLEKWKKEHAPALDLDLSKISGIVETALAGMTCHTDTHAVHDGKTLACAGCGHCKGALENPADYGLAESSGYLRRYVEESGITPEVLEGEHAEGAVIVIDKLPDELREKVQPISLPGTGADGRQSFIFHLEDYLKVIEAIAEKAGEAVKEKNPDADLKSLATLAREAAEMQTNATLERLAKGLPRFNVSYDEQGEVMVKDSS